MDLPNKNPIQLALGLGAIAGMRTMAAPAILSHYLSRRPHSGLTNTNLEFLRTSVFDKAAKLFAASEMFGDKLPQVPNRTTIGGLVGRILSGALVGAAMFKHNNGKIWKGALIGGASSVASTFLTFYLRKKLRSKAHVQDKLLGAIEDIIAVSSGMTIMKKGAA